MVVLVLEGFSCVVLYCVTGTGNKIIFGAGTNLIIETSKFINASGILSHIYLFILIVIYYVIYDHKKNNNNKKLTKV